MFKRLLALSVSIALLFTTGISMAEAAFTMTGFDGQGANHYWENNGFFARMQEKTGISFTFSVHNDSAKWQAAKDAMFAEGGTLPDVLFKASFTDEELIAYTDNGKLIDLKPLLEQYAPNLWKLMQENPAIEKAITLPNGKIGALPYINETPAQNIMWINKTWMDRLGLEMPTDLESLRTVLTAFKTQDPNYNGKADEIPLSFLGPWDLKFFSHAYGVVANDYNIYLDDSGSIHYWALEDSFAELAKVLRSFYEEGLLHESGFTTSDTIRQITDDKAAEVYGMFLSPSPLMLVSANMAKDYVMLDPLVFDGKQVYRDMDTSVTPGTFAITSACSDPAALLSWVDYLYCEEGAIQAMVGVEGIDYYVNDDGKWEYPANLDYSGMTANTVYDTGVMPWNFPWEFYTRFNDSTIAATTAAQTRLKDFLKVPYANTTLHGEDRIRIMTLQSGLGTAVDTTFARWILGEVEINDETITAFRQNLKDLGVDEMIAYWQQHAAN